jgi:NAD(P)-dependent dehydrogenase (short-subunit alcohol dehydrogenase family)
MTTYFLTGANRGIGLEFTRQLTDRGDEVIATARSPQQADKLQSLAEEESREIKIAQLDVTDTDGIQRLARDLSGDSIDVLINNAGQMMDGGTPGDIKYDNIVKNTDVNAVGPLRVIDAFLPAIREGEDKKIVNITSKMGSIADNRSGGSYAYRTSKAALNMVTKSLAVDLESEDITALILHPGWVKTRMGGQNALITVEKSVRNMLDVIDDAGLEQSGQFFEWNGNRVDW